MPESCPAFTRGPGTWGPPGVPLPLYPLLTIFLPTPPESPSPNRSEGSWGRAACGADVAGPARPPASRPAGLPLQRLRHCAEAGGAGFGLLAGVSRARSLSAPARTPAPSLLGWGWTAERKSSLWETPRTKTAAVHSVSSGETPRTNTAAVHPVSSLGRLACGQTRLTRVWEAWTRKGTPSPLPALAAGD